jgi:hypothetical protein
MNRRATPLNGTKIHPLSDAAFSAMAHMPAPYSEINAGVIARLDVEGLIDIYDDISPFKTHKGKKIRFVRLTDTGRARLEGRVR